MIKSSIGESRLRRSRPCVAAAVAAVMALVLAAQAYGMPVESVALARSTAPFENGWEPGPSRFGVEVERGVPVRMSDGVTLSTDVAYPTDPETGRRAAGAFPVILQQMPYDSSRSSIDRPSVSYFVSRGYIFVLARTRGSADSGGEFCFFCDREKRDGVDLVRWAADDLAGSNGALGLYGCSYSSFNQYYTSAIAGKGSPVKAMVAAGGHGATTLRQGFFEGGVPTDLGTAVIAGGMLAGTPSAEAWGADWLTEIGAGGPRAYDRSYWQDRSPHNYVEQVVETNVPILMYAGWDDGNDYNYQSTTPELWAMLQNAYAGRDIWAPMRPTQPTTSRYQLVMDQGHCFPNSEMELKWFDTWLKGVDTGVQDTRAPLHMRELGSDRWVDASAYPLTRRYSSYYLNAGRTLTTATPTGLGISSSVPYQAPETGAVLTYTTEPFSDGATLAGPGSLTVYASSTTKNMLLMAEMYDVAPDGTVVDRFMTGTVLGSKRELDSSRTWRTKYGQIIRPYPTLARDRYLDPDKVTQLKIPLRAVQASLAPGHRLRLLLKTRCSTEDKASTACPTPTALQEATLTGGVYHIQHNASWPSRLDLPVLPYRYFDSAPAPYREGE